MDTLLETSLRFVDQWSFVFYGVGTLGALIYLWQARKAFRQRRYSPFPIEREEATAMLRDSLVILTILVAILATTFYIDRVLLATPTIALPQPDVPVVAVATVTATFPAIGPTPILEATETVPPAEGEPTPLPAEVSPPTETPTLPTETPPPPPTETPPSTEFTATPVAATPIPTQPPAPTATTAAPSVPAARCGTPGVQINSPSNGQSVTGNVAIRGTANIDRFQFYKVEYGQGANPGSFASIGDTVTNPVNNGVLVNWAAGAFPSGIWTLRLTVVDETGNFPAPCLIYVIIP